MTSKSEDICLKIKKTNLSNEKINEMIFKEIKEIKKLLIEEQNKNKNLQKIVDELIQEKNQLKNKVEELIKWKESFKEKGLKELNNKDRKYKIDSKIINKNEEIELLAKRLTSKGFIQNKNVIFNLYI